MHDFLSEEREAGWWGEAAEVGRLAVQALNVLASRSVQPCAAQAPLFNGFINAAASGDGAAFDAAVARLREARVGPRAIVESYVPEAARRLGEDWVADRRGFAEVTIGSAALQSLVRRLSVECDAQSPRDAVTDVLLAVPDGEDHTLGACVAASWLRRNGASVTLRLQPSLKSLCEIAANGAYDLIMLSWADVGNLEKLRVIVEQLRRSMSPATPILVGGAVIGRVGGVEAVTGADLATNDLDLAMSRFSGAPKGARSAPSNAWA